MSNNPNITDEEIALIKSAQAGEIRAFNKLFYRYKGFTTNILYSYIKDYDEARDVNNIVWLKVYNKLSKFVDYSSFGGWLRVLTNRTAIDYLRKLDDLTYASESENEDLVFAGKKNTVDYDQQQVDKLAYAEVVEEFKRFPKDIRRIFELYYVENLKVKEIGEIVGMPTGTVKSHLSRKRKILKQLFNK